MSWRVLLGFGLVCVVSFAGFIGFQKYQCAALDGEIRSLIADDARQATIRASVPQSLKTAEFERAHELANQTRRELMKMKVQQLVDRCGLEATDDMLQSARSDLGL